MGSGIVSVDKAELPNKLYIECMKHIQQLNINFLTLKHAMEHLSQQNTSIVGENQRLIKKKGHSIRLGDNNHLVIGYIFICEKFYLL